MLMQYDGSSAESNSVSRPKGLLGALDQVEVCFLFCFATAVTAGSPSLSFDLHAHCLMDAVRSSSYFNDCSLHRTQPPG